MDEKKLPDRDAKPEEKDEFEQMLQTMVAQGCLWYLNRCEEFLLTEDAWGDKLPLWATAAEAEYNCTQEWDGCTAESIPLGEFLAQWIPFLRKENIGVSIGWRDGEGFVLPLDALESLLRAEAETQGIKIEEPAEDTEMEAKYTAFIEELVSGNRIWILHKGDAILMVGTEDGGRMPIWSSREAAATDCSNEWAACEPDGIPLRQFLNDWLPDLAEEGSNLLLALGDGEGINTDVEIFGRDLERELKKQAPGKVVAFRRGRRDGKKPLS